MPEETDGLEAKGTLLSMATIAEVPYPGRFNEADD